MEFPAKITNKGTITIPKSWRDLLKLEDGDVIMVSIRKKSEVDQLKTNLERPYTEKENRK